MRETSNQEVVRPPPSEVEGKSDLGRELAEARTEIARLTADYEDLKLLYEAMMEHGEAVEDQLAESNLALQSIQARLSTELADATRYVISILPEPRVERPLTDWLFVPSTELGGDSFGYHAIDEDSIALYLLDVCGHGVGAALLSVAMINVLRASSLPNADFRSPDSVLGALNEAFPMEKQNDMFFTLWYGVYRRSSATLLYATAGHPPAIHLRTTPGGKTEVSPLITYGGLAIGAFPGAAYECRSHSIEAGDRLLILSDGTFEVDGAEGGILGFDDLVQFVIEHGDEPQGVLDWVRSLNRSGPLPDDFSLLRVIF